ncbi:hypothetical protein FRX31_009208 [Thalictrum thalictroides]|uniref:Uncharacterized protein n=1 Tax=Thalictrum thalictroides TaxID=46969 RepID=A0A7J6WXE1_THATH|nr:hypothetical protein FRX31_009208 [Thalictrum thalictroides]
MVTCVQWLYDRIFNVECAQETRVPRTAYETFLCMVPGVFVHAVVILTLVRAGQSNMCAVAIRQDFQCEVCSSNACATNCLRAFSMYGPGHVHSRCLNSHTCSCWTT